MTVHAFRLMEAHQRIDDQLRLESGRRWPDAFKLKRLKKMKLRIKDRLAAIATKRGSAAQ